ncbi:MAG: hypothetical protein IJM84_02225, partial [Bacteroidaceae bacterium]|nr:hypothetical protein [Bacteroidaceae bacterium]
QPVGCGAVRLFLPEVTRRWRRQNREFSTKAAPQNLETPFLTFEAAFVTTKVQNAPETCGNGRNAVILQKNFFDTCNF